MSDSSQFYGESRFRKPWLVSLFIFLLAVSGMAWLRMVLFPDRFLTLAYSLPLLICLWHRDRFLLWAMVVAFITMSTIKTWVLLGVDNAFQVAQWSMQLANIVATAAVVHCVILLMARLRQKNEELEKTNAELAAREEEISRQNEELQAQGEEMAQQNEELEHQAEELQAQGEELQNLNSELSQREAALQEILLSLSRAGDEHAIVHDICMTLARLLGPGIKGVALVERSGEDVVIQTWYGQQAPSLQRWPFARSFCAVLVSEERTASVDLGKRPDFALPHMNGTQFRSLLGTPLRIKGQIVGAVKAYSDEPKEWTREHFRIIEWVASQCAMALEITRLRQEMRAVNASLEEAVKKRTAELQEMVDELEHFSYTITHDMRAPLRAMQGFAGMLEEELSSSKCSPEARDCLEHLSRSAERMDRLITDALSYSKAVQQELAVGAVDAENLLRGIVYSYPLLQPPRARIHIQSDIPPVLANDAGLTQCLSNLLTNAVKFVPPNVVPEVRITAETSGGVVRIWIADNGIGIPHQAHGRLFKMFQRASKEYEGTGIGLALVRKVATRMNGQVGFESAPGQGSRFWIELPLASGRSPGTNGNTPSPAQTQSSDKFGL
jgi:signal transduction histidine kinase